LAVNVFIIHELKNKFVLKVISAIIKHRTSSGWSSQARISLLSADTYKNMTSITA